MRDRTRHLENKLLVSLIMLMATMFFVLIIEILFGGVPLKMKSIQLNRVNFKSR